MNVNALQRIALPWGKVGKDREKRYRIAPP